MYQQSLFAESELQFFKKTIREYRYDDRTVGNGGEIRLCPIYRVLSANCELVSSLKSDFSEHLVKGENAFRDIGEGFRVFLEVREAGSFPITFKALFDGFYKIMFKHDNLLLSRNLSIHKKEDNNKAAGAYKKMNIFS